MSYCKNNAIRCDECGLFCYPYDEETPFGCKDPEAPEPLDPYHYCKKCHQKQVDRWRKHFEQGYRTGYWQKSNAEREAAKEFGLVWIHSNCLGTYNTPDDSGPYIYITKEKYDRIKDQVRYPKKQKGVRSDVSESQAYERS